MIREASNAHNLKALLPIITPKNAPASSCHRRPFPRRLDRRRAHRLHRPHGDPRGLDPVTAIQIATLNAAEYFNLHDRGAIAPGRRADLIIFDNFSKNLTIGTGLSRRAVGRAHGRTCRRRWGPPSPIAQ